MSNLSVQAQQRLYDTLKRIARDYLTPDQIRRSADKDYGLDAAEAIEMAYENIQGEAARAIHGLRRPAEKVKP